MRHPIPSPRTSLRFRIRAVLLTALLLGVWSIPAAADIGPKPTMAFTWDLSNFGEPPSIEDVTLYQCGDDPDCTSPEVVEELGAQRMTCDESGCFAMLYSSGGYWQLGLVLNGVPLTSAPFDMPNYDSDYTVVLYPDRAEIIPVPPAHVVEVADEPSFGSSRLAVTLTSLAFALVATLVVELIIAWIYLARTQRPRRLLALTLLGNIITVPIIWLVIPLFTSQYVIAVFIQFLTATVLEAIIYGLFGGTSMRWKGSIALAWWTNLSSEVLGFMFFLVLGLLV